MAQPTYPQRQHRIALELHTEGRDWYTRHSGDVPLDVGFGRNLIPTNLGEKTSEIDALFFVKHAYPTAEVSISRGALGGIHAGLF